MLDFLLEEKQVWSGTATELCAALVMLDRTFSMSPVSLSKLLRSRQEFLRQHHKIECVFDRNKTKRFIELSRDVIIVDYENSKREPLGLVG